MYLRKSIHLPVLLAVVLYFAHLWEWVSLNRSKEVFVFLLLVLAVYAIVFAIAVHYDKKLAEKLNHRLRERYRS